MELPYKPNSNFDRHSVLYNVKFAPRLSKLTWVTNGEFLKRSESHNVKRGIELFN